jgi:nicotinate-nucleotide pyrophosphorylase (carboxylating)
MAEPTFDREVFKLVRSALAEDVGAGDITSEAIVPADAQGRARINQKQPGVIFGLRVVEEAFKQCGANWFDTMVVEGQWRDGVPAQLALVTGPARGLLAAERVALNLLGHLSGIATLTAHYVRAVEGTHAQILDTRKTTPGLRFLEKQAVLAGGGTNHRIGLYDAVLIKENHIAIAGGILPAVERVLQANPEAKVEVECTTLSEVSEALRAQADRILLDNMETNQMASCVTLARGAEHEVSLEASGGVNLQTVRGIAETGVDFISVGALTHSAPALDVSMLLEPYK